MPLVEDYAKLVTLVTDTQDDLNKAAAGNKAASTRARKAMQEVKKLAQTIRAGALEATQKE